MEMDARQKNSKMTYEEAIRTFRWSDVLNHLDWKDGDQVNLGESIIAHQNGQPDNTALQWLGAKEQIKHISYRELDEESARVANLLCQLGINKGDRVAAMMPRVPETFAVIIGILKLGAIYVPIFTGFGTDAVDYRLRKSGAKLLITHHEFRHRVPAVSEARILVLGVSGEAMQGDDIDLRSAINEQSKVFEARTTDRSDPAAIIYTSGSTGLPKGCVIAVNMLAAMWPYMRYCVDLQAKTDIFWPTGDPGWGYGLCCYLPALAAGAKILTVEQNPNPEMVIDILRKFEVTNLATTPTLLRGVMALGRDQVARHKLSIRAISSCGEPLNGEVVDFFKEVWGVMPMDHFGATEFGLPIGNLNAIDMTVKSGSMGLTSPGYRMAVVDGEGRELPAGETGLIGQRSTENSLYWLEYWEDQEASKALYRNGWTCTGDLARQDEDGYFWFEGRSDDMIKSSGYRISSFEVESMILKHPAVAEGAVIAKPDQLRGHIVKAYVVLKSGENGSDTIADEIVKLVRKKLGKHQYPREIEFVDSLPKTQTGKIQRFALRQRSNNGN